MVNYFCSAVTNFWVPWPRHFLLLAGVLLAVVEPGTSGAAQAGQIIFVRASEPAAGAKSGQGGGRQIADDLQAGLRLARELRQEIGDHESIVVELQSGTHRLREAVRITREDSGTQTAPLVIRGESGHARLSGAVVLNPTIAKGARADANSIGVPKAALGRVASYTLPHPFSDAARIDVVRMLGSPSAPMPFELFDSHGPLRPARWPNDGFALASGVAGSVAKLRVSTDVQERLIRWSRSPEPWIGGFLRKEYSHDTHALAQINEMSGELIIDTSGGEQLAETIRYAVHHVAAEVDVPGEWVRSSAGNVVHVLPRPDGGAVEVSLAQNLVVLDGARHVRIQGISFERSRGGAVIVSGATDVLVSDCDVRETGGFGIAFADSVFSGVARCRFQDVGDEGVRLGGGDRYFLTPGNNSITDSIFQRFARHRHVDRPAVSVSGVGQSVIGSYFADGPQQAIIISGNDHVIEQNEITRVVGDCSDCGAIYMVRDWTARGTVIRHNFLHDIGTDGGGPTGREVKGIYLDDFTSGIAVRENVLLRVDQGVFIGGGRDNLVERNLFVSSEPAVHVDGRGLTWAQEAVRNPEGELRGNLAAVPVQSVLWRSRYPRLATLMGKDPARPAGNRVAGNLFASVLPVRLLAEVQNGEVDFARLGGGNAELGADEIQRLGKANSAADIRSLGAAALIRLGLAHLPLERMDRSRVLAGAAAARGEP